MRNARVYTPSGKRVFSNYCVYFSKTFASRRGLKVTTSLVYRCAAIYQKCSVICATCTSAPMAKCPI